MAKSPEYLTIPSPIDVHVHLREPGGETAETIGSGTMAALAGGYQAVMDMPNNPRFPTWTRERIIEKQEIAQHSAAVDIGFYGGVNLADPDLEAVGDMVGASVGLKLYMGRTTGNAIEYGLDEAREVIDTHIAAARAWGVRSPIVLHAREEIGRETADYIADQGHGVHWAHIATNTEALAAERLGYHHPDFFTAGVTPHHLRMTERDTLKYGWNGAKMQPPLGREIDSDSLLYHYNQGHIQILETDHAPHTLEAKRKAEWASPLGTTETHEDACFGVSGIEFVLPVMTAMVKARKLSMERLVDSLYDQPARMLGIKLGGQALRSQTILSIEPYTIGEGDIVGQSHNTPYVGWTGWARVAGRKRDGVTTEMAGLLYRGHHDVTVFGMD